MMHLRTMASLAATLFVAAACTAPPPPSGSFPPNPRRADAAPVTLIDTVPTGQRCIVTGGKAQPLTVTTPRLVALHEYGDAPVIDCFGDGFLRQRKAVLANKSKRLAERLIVPGVIDPAFAPYPKREKSSGLGDFPAWVRIRLQRNSFKTIAERDQYYAAEARWIAAAWDTIEYRLKQECQSRLTQAQGLILLDTQCKKAFRALADRRAADRATVEVNRRQSTIR
ncbi:hypothetical protein [Nisaea nitritireducens]|uniref:hypothetical protein n=1 Tax=Nisaea nitritireducens TaxID=568392 RepID=UPI0018691C1A|nr:hypothetical protein [Nisaea nitritireducens]